MNKATKEQPQRRTWARPCFATACLTVAVLATGCGEEATDRSTAPTSDPTAATATQSPNEEPSDSAERSSDEPTQQDHASEIVDGELIEFGFGVNEEQGRLINQVETDGVDVVASMISWDEPDGPVLVVYVSEPWEPPAEGTFEFPVRVVVAEAVDRAALVAASDAWYASDLGHLIAVGSSLILIPPGGLELGIHQRFEGRVEVRSIGHATEISLVPNGDEDVPDPFTLTVPVTTYFAGEVSRPGFSGDSGYWFPTPVGAVCWAA